MLGTGIPLREFLHVDDLADACLFVLENWDIKNELVLKDEHGNVLNYLNVGTGKDISIKELAIDCKSMGYKGSIEWEKNKLDGTYKKQLDTTRINNLDGTLRLNSRWIKGNY